MTATARTDMINGFIEEVKTYIDPLYENIDQLFRDLRHKQALMEIHRLVHTIKGASSMVGLKGLSAIALQMENDLDKIVEGEYKLDEATLRVMRHVVDRFDNYCEGYSNDGARVRDLLNLTFTEYDQLRRDGVKQDDESRRSLLDNLPEIEISDRTDVKSDNDAVECAHDWGDQQAEIENDEDLSVSSFPELEEALIESDPISNADSSPSIKKKCTPLPAELMESFLEEAEEHLDTLGSVLNNLTEQITAESPIDAELREEIRRMRRAVHTLKGAAAVIGFHQFSGFAHCTEDLLDWLFETAESVNSEVIDVLAEATDLLEVILNQPDDNYDERIGELLDRIHSVLPATVEGNRPAIDSGGQSRPSVSPAASAIPIPDEDTQQTAPTPDPTAEADLETDKIHRTQTMRVNMDRVDDLVNLAGELMIAASGFDQRMIRFREAVAELALARDRLREIARELEINYEVRALEKLGTIHDISLLDNPGKLQDTANNDFDAIELDRYSELNLIIRTLNETVVDVGTINTQTSDLHGEFDGLLIRQQTILSDLQDSLMRVRMLPMASIANRLHRTVREMATILDKKVNLQIEGTEIELDRTVWEKLTDPLMHLLRNAVDHGIESAEQRRLANKPPTAQIQLSAFREGNQVVIRIADDGAGLDLDTIAARAVENGLCTQAQTQDKAFLKKMIFHPGFSTRRKISQISGRGVGMDVVATNVRALRGDIQVESTPGQDTVFTLRIPLTLAAIQALLFTVGGTTYAIPLNEILQIIRLETVESETDKNDVVRIGEDVLPLFDLKKLLHTGKFESARRTGTKPPLLVIVETVGRRAAVQIDTLINQKEIVLKNLGSHLQYVKGVSGATILGDGQIVPILDLKELLWSEDEAITEPALPESQTSEQELSILVVDDSVSIRTVLSAFLKKQGWSVTTAKDGIDALDILNERLPDLIILDIEMPRMNGYELLGTLRSQDDFSKVPVIMLSSRTASKHKQKAMALGASGYMIKPYEEKQFLEQILQLTKRGKTCRAC